MKQLDSTKSSQKNINLNSSQNVSYSIYSSSVQAPHQAKKPVFTNLIGANMSDLGNRTLLGPSTTQNLSTQGMQRQRSLGGKSFNSRGGV